MSSKKGKAKTAPVSTPAPATKKPGKRGIVKNGNAGSNKAPEEDQSHHRSIFGDWTGKTPVSLLHEHCQKVNWEKPSIDMKKQKNGFLATVQLSQRNKKTAQMQTVSFTPPDEYVLPTAVEAKHLGATFALHRVKSHMPLYRVLPPEHRTYWGQFETYKTKANAWQYDPDPFTAHPPAPARRKQQKDLPSKEHAASAVPMPMRMDEEKDRREPEMDEKMRKYWASLPSVQMGAENRDLVERVVKRSKIVYQPVRVEKEKERKKESMLTILSSFFSPVDQKAYKGRTKRFGESIGSPWF
jgi:ATP-dependent RNA helicase DHX57